MKRLATVSVTSVLAAMLFPVPGASAATPAIEVREATNVRSIYTSEFGEARPAALTYSPEEKALFTADDAVDGSLNLVGVTTVEDPVGDVTATVPETTTTADTLAFDPLAGEFTALSGDVLVSITPTGVVDRRNVSDLGLQAPDGATFDRAGRWYILDETQTILQLSSATDPAATVVEIPIRGLAGLPLQGLAYNKADGFLYTMDSVSKILYGIDKDGRVRRAWDLNARVRAPGSMVFAPSADNTDDPAETSLFLADSGSDAVLGQVLEVSLAAAVAAPVNQNATLVRTSNLAALNPPVPDSSGITYIPSQNNMMIVDSEVEEMSIYNNANMFKTTLTGGLVQTGNTLAFSDEPTGAGFRTANSQLYISDDDANRVFLDRPGPDGRWGNGDDLTGNVNTRNFGSEDAEGAAFNNATDHYYVIDGTGNEVYDIAPGPNGVPGNGVPPQGDDVATHFDVGQFGAVDPEGIAVDEVNNTIFILDHKSQKIYETSVSGTLLRTISISAANAINPAGLEYARSSASASVKNFYIVDRGLDNDSNPNENDGKMYEMSVGSAPNTAPVVNAGPDQTVQFPTTVTLTGTVTDDGQPAPPGTTTKQWTKVSGPGTVNFSAPTATTTQATFSQAGTYVLRLTANDSALSGSDDVTVIEVANQAPAVNAGPDQTVPFPTTVTLNGTVNDDGFPAPPGSTTKQWTKVSGPGTVTFTSPTSANTDATFSQAGTYVLRLTANDGALSGSDDVTITETSPANQAPTVNAGPDQTVPFPTTVTLNGTVNDDGLPASPGSTSKQWTKVSGPGTVTFTSPTTANTDATFSQAGTYVLRLTANDGELSGSDDVTITENAPAGNQAPVVNAGPDQTVPFPTTVTLNGTVNDDGLPASPGSTTKQWTKISGPGDVTFTSPTTANTDASFSQAGVYVLRLTANDGELSGSDEVTITENAGGTPVILNRSITAGSDDAEQQASGAVDLASSDIELVQDGSSNNQTDGLRFTNITVPSGATITNAYIQFQVDEATTATGVSLTVRGELSPNPLTFTTATNNVSSRPNTAASVPWTNVPGWPTVGARGPDQRTPEIKTIVQEIIGQGGWTSGNAMAFKITGTGKRTAEAFESGAAIAASLHIEYTT